MNHMEKEKLTIHLSSSAGAFTKVIENADHWTINDDDSVSVWEDEEEETERGQFWGVFAIYRGDEPQ